MQLLVGTVAAAAAATTKLLQNTNSTKCAYGVILQNLLTGKQSIRKKLSAFCKRERKKKEVINASVRMLLPDIAAINSAYCCHPPL